MIQTIPRTVSRPQPAWAKAILTKPIEFDRTPLPVLAGTVPIGLRGSLYRNGAARLERGGQRVGHWFDGDGAILKVEFTPTGATGLFRYVQTAGYQQEEQAGMFQLSGYGMLPPGQWWQRWGKGLKNAANTSVIALPDKLLALWEGGPPHAIDLESLSTLGLDDLQGLENLPYSAHPKVDPATGDIFNFGVSLGAKARLNLYRSDRTGQIRQKGSIDLPGLPVIHDFVLAGRYLVFCIPPVRLNPLPILAYLKTYSDALHWQPDLGTEIIVVDRASLEVVSRTQTEPWYQWHFGNGYELADGSVVLEIVRYADFQTNQFLKEVARGQTQTFAPGSFWQLRLNPQTGKVLEMQQILDRPCEFPIVPTAAVGQPHRDTYLSLHRQGVEMQQELF
ncbi:MAG TPA: carotenoid oxygenase family protein, partial [Thermosynechococcaceae cyanobacterium]